MTQWDYNSADLPKWMRYPDGEQVTYGYNSRMLVDTLSDAANYVTSTAYDAAGRVSTRGLENGLSQSFGYYAWNEKATLDGNLTGQGGRLKNLGAGTLQGLSLFGNEAGRVRNNTID